MGKFTGILAILLFFSFPSLGQVDDFLLYWDFDTIINNHFDEHSNASDGGTSYNCTSIEGVRGNALEFNGTNSYVRIPGDSLAPPDTLRNLQVGSISLWFRVDSIPMGNGIAPIFYYGANDACTNMFDASNQGLIIEAGHSPIHMNSRRLYFTIFHNNCWMPSFCYDSWIPLVEGKWYHFVAVVDSNYNTGYLNGSEMWERHYNFGNTNTSEFFYDAMKHENLWLGRGYWDAETKYLKGAVDEVKIFSRPLGDEDVDLLFAEGTPPVFSQEIKYKKEFVEVYPVPAQKEINCRIKKSAEDITSVIITSMLNTVKSMKINEDYINIDIQDLNPGIYSILFFSGNRLIAHKQFIKL